MMEIRVLKYFLAVAREENITKAAALLHITQPTLSRQLMQLEEELGIKLLRRSKHSVLLTEEGMLLRRRAQEIVDLAEKTEKELIYQEENIAGEIAIGCGETKNMKLLSEMITSFQQQYTNVSFEIYTAIADDVKEKLNHGILDMGLLLEPVEISKYHFVKMPLKETLNVLMRKDDPLAQKQKITPYDLINVPLILPKRLSVCNEIENWFDDAKKQMKLVCTVNLSKDNISYMVEAGMGIAMIIEFGNNNSNLCFKPIEPEIKNDSVLVWRKNQTLSPAMFKFISHIKTYLEKSNYTC